MGGPHARVAKNTRFLAPRLQCWCGKEALAWPQAAKHDAFKSSYATITRSAVTALRRFLLPHRQEGRASLVAHQDRSCSYRTLRPCPRLRPLRMALSIGTIGRSSTCSWGTQLVHLWRQSGSAGPWWVWWLPSLRLRYKMGWWIRSGGEHGSQWCRAEAGGQWNRIRDRWLQQRHEHRSRSWARSEEATGQCAEGMWLPLQPLLV